MNVVKFTNNIKFFHIILKVKIVMSLISCAPDNTYNCKSVYSYQEALERKDYLVNILQDRDRTKKLFNEYNCLLYLYLYKIGDYQKADSIAKIVNRLELSEIQQNKFYENKLDLDLEFERFEEALKTARVLYIQKPYTISKDKQFRLFQYYSMTSNIYLTNGNCDSAQSSIKMLKKLCRETNGRKSYCDSISLGIFEDLFKTKCID